MEACPLAQDTARTQRADTAAVLLGEPDALPEGSNSGEVVPADVQLHQLWSDLSVKRISNALSPSDWPGARQVYRHLIGEDADYHELLTTRVDSRAEAEPAKVLCAVGAVALAEIVWKAGVTRGWTGLFSGESSGLGVLRLSTAARPPFGPGGGAPSFLSLAAGSLRDAVLFPCVALKIPRTGAPSGNLLFLGRKTGQPSPNFFASCVATCATEKCSAVVKPVLNSFRRFSKYPCHLGLSDFAKASVDERSATEGSARFPWALVLRPNEEAQNLASSAGEVQGDAPAHFLAQLDVIPAGTTLYDVFAVTSPEGALPANVKRAKRINEEVHGLLHVGTLVTRTQFIRSLGESSLRFWHQCKEEDYELRPEWAAAHGDHHTHMCGAEYFSKVIETGHYR
ncbi:hypothetical protein AB1Y20_001412 [Prymnesium parvum]|uniref:Mono(ADP-ribosyl)transferase n=1 Tax=Prymnesium parvum TaxID=97485 RepID=A0AB34K899_PRYPA